MKSKKKVIGEKILVILKLLLDILKLQGFRGRLPLKLSKRGDLKKEFGKPWSNETITTFALIYHKHKTVQFLITHSKTIFYS